ncbi:MAG: CvpA family protein [Granulosicoccus sp.]|nr:CvpA family protein [Granulosicoccus sp.]
MSEIDLVILAIIAISALISFMRGFFREAMSLGTWLAAILITLMFTSRFAILLPLDTVESPQARATISALTLFVGTLLIGNLINWMFARIMARTTLGLADRAVGVGFGAVRGAIIVTLLVLGANLVPELKQETWWKNSTLLPRFQQAAQFVHAQMPDGIGQHFDFIRTTI